MEDLPCLRYIPSRKKEMKQSTVTTPGTAARVAINLRNIRTVKMAQRTAVTRFKQFFRLVSIEVRAKESSSEERTSRGDDGSLLTRMNQECDGQKRNTGTSAHQKGQKASVLQE